MKTLLYDGTIHLRFGSKTYPQNLKIELNVANENPAQVMTSFKETVKAKDIDKMIIHFEKEHQDKYRSLFEVNIDKLNELAGGGV